MKTIITKNPEQTKELAKQLASSFRGGEIACLSGDLGAGKTTFTQGLLEALGAEGPYTSPTFVVIKNYKSNFKFQISNFKLSDVYHIDAYRIDAEDLLALGWSDFAGKPETITIIEWPENVKEIIPSEKAIWIHFEWISENDRKITINKRS